MGFAEIKPTVFHPTGKYEKKSSAIGRNLFKDLKQSNYIMAENRWQIRVWGFRGLSVAGNDPAPEEGEKVAFQADLSPHFLKKQIVEITFVKTILGLALLNIFDRHMNTGIECTPSKFANDTKLCGAVDLLGGRDAFQRVLDRFECLCMNLMRFSKAKCKVLHMGWANPKHKYRPRGEWLETSSEKRDLRVLADEKLNLTQQCALAARKADHILGSDSAPLLCSHETSPGVLWVSQHKEDMSLLE
ncbi:rna-directed dna polymerase from mobile element jockey-like [Pitangus sulphuratus]|nr:rna-directed dna polymerase from mobile element jockey-like [Pitangus sulphuratus]